MQARWCSSRKRISAEILMEANEYLLARKDDDNNSNTPPSAGNSGDNGASDENTNKGTLTLDATCAPANIHYPQDISQYRKADGYAHPCHGSMLILLRLGDQLHLRRLPYFL